MRKCCHESIRPIAWLVGRWKTDSGECFHPTAKPMTYRSLMVFESTGQPVLNYTLDTWHPELRTPNHLEKGFLRINEHTNEVAFAVAHNLGLTTLEEGFVCDNEITCKSVSVSNMRFVRDPETVAVERTFKLTEEGNLEMVVSMATSEIPMTPHMKAVYQKA